MRLQNELDETKVILESSYLKRLKQCSFLYHGDMIQLCKRRSVCFPFFRTALISLIPIPNHIDVCILMVFDVIYVL
ncbi:unnamed protein product [Trichobilharzia regenti]|nr:unnamed protein product [Trichobilharzia regenti]